MYEAFFGLATKPFELVPNPKFLYHSRSHRKALNYLKYGMREGVGFILLTGEVGSGKTTLIRNLIGDRDSDVILAMLFNTKVNNKQLLTMINEDFGLPVAGRDKVGLLRELNDFLVEMHAQHKRPVLIIDEAQNLTASALEEIRLLSNLEASDAKLLQIIMVGQPELNKTIARNELRQLRQRISVHCQLDPLNRQETEDYVFHRLDLAGNRQAVHWGEGTFDALYRYSHGIPRLINIFCDFILLAAFVEETRELDLELVDEVLGDTSWDQQVRENLEVKGRKSIMANHQILERLSRHEQKIAQLDELAIFRDELAARIQTLEELLKKMHEQQQSRFIQMEAGLEQTCQQLQDYVKEQTVLSPRSVPTVAPQSQAPPLSLFKNISEKQVDLMENASEPPVALDDEVLDEPLVTASELRPQAPPRKSLLARLFS